SAFLTGMSVLFVPLLERLVYRRAVKPAAWIGVTLAVVGMGLMSGASVEAGVRIGDLLALASAGPFALQIIWTAERSARHPLVPLTTIQFGVCLIGAAVMLTLETPRLAATPAFALALAYMGVVMTTGAFFVQNWAQRHISPTRAALIFALEPVFAALVSS